MKVLENVMLENKKLKVTIVSNLVRESTRIGQGSLNILSKRYGNRVSKVVIPMATLFEKAEVEKKPLVVAYPDRREAGMFADLAEELLVKGNGTGRSYDHRAKRRDLDCQDIQEGERHHSCRKLVFSKDARTPRCPPSPDVHTRRRLSRSG